MRKLVIITLSTLLMFTAQSYADSINSKSLYQSILKSHHSPDPGKGSMEMVYGGKDISREGMISHDILPQDNVFIG